MTAARPAARIPAGARASLWRQLNAQHGPAAIAGRYATLARLRAERVDPLFAASAREDVIRLATALGAVLNLHTPDQRHRCRACAAGPFLVEWPCRTRRAADDGLRLSWPAPTQTGEPVPDAHEAFAMAVLAVHDILPAVGGHPACCRTCLVPPGDCPIWVLADGFLGITWTGPAGQPAGPPADLPAESETPAAGTR